MEKKENSKIDPINLLYGLLLYYLFKGILYFFGLSYFSIIPYTKGDVILLLVFVIFGSLIIHYFLKPLIKKLKNLWDDIED